MYNMLTRAGEPKMEIRENCVDWCAMAFSLVTLRLAVRGRAKMEILDKEVV